MKILKAWFSEVADPCRPLGYECSCFSGMASHRIGPELCAKSAPTSRELRQTVLYIGCVLALVVGRGLVYAPTAVAGPGAT